MKDNWYKNEPGDKIWWLDNRGEAIGEFVFSFDKKTTYNLHQDYYKLTEEQRAIFDKENPFWADYFRED